MSFLSNQRVRRTSHAKEYSGRMWFGKSETRFARLYNTVNISDIKGLMTVADGSAVRAQLGKILASPVFANSPRMSRFLRFIVETTLDGNGERIKEYVIAIEVFEKAEDYDPQADSTVRTEASKLRSRLTRYYETEGREDLLVITIPKGSYVPQFENCNHGTPATSSVTNAPAAAQKKL